MFLRDALSGKIRTNVSEPRLSEKITPRPNNI
jgi:hypothetical protein